MARRGHRAKIGAAIEAGSRVPAPPRHGVDWAFWPVALAFVGYFMAMTAPWILGRVTIPWDAKAHFQPQIQFLADSFARGEWPWWNPFVFSGQPQVADPQSMIFSPPMLALALVNKAPSLWAVDMTVLAAMAVGGVGLILWFRDRGWHWAGALLAALAFSFGAAMGWRLQHTGQVLSLAYLPWAMVFLERAIERRSVLNGLLAGLVAAFIVLGRDQVALLCVYLLIGRVLWLWASADAPVDAIKGSLLPLIAAGIVGLALIVAPIAMTLALAAESNRPVIDFEGAGRGSLHPALLVTGVAPQVFGAAGRMEDYWGPPSFAWNDTGLFIAQNVGQLYVGAIPLLLLAWGALSGRLWDREVRFFAIALGVMLLYALGWYTPVFRGFYEVLPGVKLYRRPADAVFLIGALAAVLAGYMAHRLFSQPWERPSLRLIAGVGGALLAVAALCVLLGVRLDRLARVPMPLGGALALFAAGAALLWLATGRIAAAPVQAATLLAVFTAADIGWNNGPTTSSALPTAHYEAMEPATKNDTIAFLKANVVNDDTRRDRIELAGLGFHWPNVSMTHRLENTLGYNPVRLGHYSRATGAEDHIGLPDQRKWSPLMPSYRSHLADMLGLRFIAAGAPLETFDKAAPKDAFRLVARTKEAYIYENPAALPRVLFATEARRADFEAIITTGRWPDFDPRQTVLIDGPRDSKPSRLPGAARIVSYTNTEVVVDVASLEGGFLVLNDIWHPWWQAEVQTFLPSTDPRVAWSSPRRRVQIHRANVLFRAVEVPAGGHRVIFTFRPLDGVRRQLAPKR